MAKSLFCYKTWDQIFELIEDNVRDGVSSLFTRAILRRTNISELIRHRAGRELQK